MPCSLKYHSRLSRLPLRGARGAGSLKSLEHLMNTLQQSQAPLLFVDIDGVISLFGFETHRRPAGTFHTVEGIPHFLSAAAARHLHALSDHFDLVWCTGWEEKANEHLPYLLGMSGPLPYLSFDRNPGRGHGHWKIAAIEAHAGMRPLAWIDDALDQACRAWAARRPEPTLLVQTEPAIGITGAEVAELVGWADRLASR
jgi:hypothetical protein